MRKLVFPGDLLFDGQLRTRGVYVENGKSYASLIGLYDDSTKAFIPLEGAYEPQEGDLLIGVVSDVRPNGYYIDAGMPNESFLSSKDYKEPLEVGDIIIAKVRGVDEVRSVTISDPAVLRGGNIIHVSPVKIPRIIGKKGSMLMQIKEATKSKIVVGKNGWIWISGGDTYLATKAILKIESEAHTSGLTEKIAEFLKKGGKNVE
ncbi:MAG: exosome complex protein Rrp4 [Candidatus Micrarchaeia archaeon]